MKIHFLLLHFYRGRTLAKDVSLPVREKIGITVIRFLLITVTVVDLIGIQRDEFLNENKCVFLWMLI